VINAKELFAELPEERQKAILARTEAMVKEMTLAQLRKACQRSQVKVAKKLGIKQAAVSRVERRPDMYVSTLRDIVKAMGGTLKMVAQFPDRPDVFISLSDALKAATKTTPAKPPRRRRSAPASVPSVRGLAERKSSAKTTSKIGSAAKDGLLSKKKAHR
jgi:hypothetical protein